jgi:hypothetical protein
MTPTEFQIGIIKLKRPFPIKEDLTGEGGYHTIVVEPGNIPLFLNRKWVGKEVRCYPKAQPANPDFGQVRLTWTWSEHEVAASVMHSSLANCPNFWDFQIDLAVVVPEWHYKEVELKRTGDANLVTVETLGWGEASFRDA